MLLLGSAACFGQLPSAKLPPHVKLLPNTRPPAAAMRVLPAPQASTTTPARCGHILVYGSKSMQTADPKFVIPIPPDKKGTMPVIPAMPPCPEDFR